MEAGEMDYDDEDYHGGGHCPGSHGPSRSGGPSRCARGTAVFPAASSVPRSCWSSKHQHLAMHTELCYRISLIELQILSLLCGELPSIHIPPPCVGNPMGVPHIRVWAVLGAMPGISISSS